MAAGYPAESPQRHRGNGRSRVAKVRRLLLCVGVSAPASIMTHQRLPLRGRSPDGSLKMICNDFLVVKVNCWSYVFNIIKST